MILTYFYFSHNILYNILVFLAIEKDFKLLKLNYIGMKISEGINILNAQLLLMRTPCGRPINQYAQECLEAAISDVKNHDKSLAKCQNCCIISSSLLMADGCPNCHGHDIDIKNIQ